MSPPAVKTRPAPDPGVILSRATVRAARFLAVAQADLAQVIGVSGATLSRIDRESVVEGKSVDLGGRRIIKKKKTLSAFHLAKDLLLAQLLPAENRADWQSLYLRMRQ